jgi:serine/threonine protein kinase
VLPKSLAATPGFAERFNREGRVLARLSHPSIVAVHDFGESGGFAYLIMEFVDGVNLRQAMRAGRFTPEQALRIIPAICDALQFAHTQGVLHRDIKPENILLDTSGKREDRRLRHREDPR